MVWSPGPLVSYSGFKWGEARRGCQSDEEAAQRSNLIQRSLFKRPSVPYKRTRSQRSQRRSPEAALPSRVLHWVPMPTYAHGSRGVHSLLYFTKKIRR